MQGQGVKQWSPSASLRVAKLVASIKTAANASASPAFLTACTRASTWRSCAFIKKPGSSALKITEKKFSLKQASKQASKQPHTSASYFSFNCQLLLPPPTCVCLLRDVENVVFLYTTINCTSNSHSMTSCSEKIGEKLISSKSFTHSCARLPPHNTRAAAAAASHSEEHRIQMVYKLCCCCYRRIQNNKLRQRRVYMRALLIFLLLRLLLLRQRRRGRTQSKPTEITCSFLKHVNTRIHVYM